MRLLATTQGIVAAPAPVAARRNWLKRLAALVGLAALARPAQASPAQINGGQPYVGEIMLFAGNFAPDGWMFCQGQIVSISDYTTLFTLIGTIYGGDGSNTFGLPDLRSRTPQHVGTGGGGTYTIGQAGGTESLTLNAVQLPTHNHGIASTGTTATSSSPVGNVQANATGLDVNGEVVAINAYAAPGGTATEDATTLSSTGGGQAISLQPAVQAVNYCISMYGIFPSPN